MKKLVKVLIIFIVIFEVLLVMSVVNITNERVKSVHDIVVKKVINFFEQAWQKVHKFFCRGSTRSCSGGAEVAVVHTNSSDLLLLLASKSSYEFQGGGV